MLLKKLIPFLCYCCLCCISFSISQAQTNITSISAGTAPSVSSVKTVTAPADAVVAVKDYQVTYGTGNLRPLSSFIANGDTYNNFILPDTVILQRLFAGDEQLTAFYSQTGFNATPTPGTINIETTGVVAGDSIYLLNALNAGLTNVLSNIDDVSSGFEVETERVDFIWFQGIRTTEPTQSAFPVFDVGGNDNVAMAAITSLDANGQPASYGQIVGIGENGANWGGTISIGNITVFRQETSALDNLPFQNFNSQSVEGAAVTFAELGIAADENFFGFSLFAPDVVANYDPDDNRNLGPGPHGPAVGIDLADISTFPDDTPRSIAGLDLVISASTAASVNDAIYETVGPGGYKEALRTWLKADDGAFVSNGGAEATEGANVGFWQDQSVGKYDYSTSGTGSAPTFRNTSSSINFNPTVDFIENSDRALSTANNSDYNDKAGNTGFLSKGINIAFRTNENDINTKQQLFEEGGGTNGLGIYIRAGALNMSVWNRGSQAQGDWNDDNSGVETVSKVVNLDTEYILTLEFDGDDSGSKNGSIKGYLNGELIGTLDNPFSQGVGLLYNHGGGIELGDSDGSRYDDGGAAASSFEGEIAEFIYCNEPNAFTIDQRQRTESYLAVKYGITLDQSIATNYLNSSGNIIFNTSNPASIGGFLEYNKDIAGIGRDDASELLQLQSKSENDNSLLTVERVGNLANDNTWLIWGNDDGAIAETDLLTQPDTIESRIGRVWRISETNDAGNVSITFDLGELGLTSKNANQLSLLVAPNNSNGNFSSATVITNAVIASDEVTFSDVDLEDGQYITLGTEYFLCSPGGVETDLYVWLRADKNTFNTGTTQATDGQTVDTWQDQSVTGTDATEDGNPPIFRDNGVNNINYNPVLDFDGTNDRLSLGNLANIKSGATNGGDYTMLGVGIREDGTEWNFVVGSQGGTSNEDLHFGYRNNNSQATLAHWGNDLNVPTNAHTNPLSPFILFGEYDGAVGRILEETRGDNFARNTDANSTDLQGTRTNYIGDVENLGNFNGPIPEVIIFDNDITDLQKQQLMTYIAFKYGITLTNNNNNDATVNGVLSGAIREGDYVASDGSTVLWNYNNNSTYSNDIAGIGRDDKSCLIQRQSRSTNTNAIVAMGIGEISLTNSTNPNEFVSDQSYLFWGNDGASAAESANVAYTEGIITERMLRIWRVEENQAAVGNTDISFDLSGLGYTGSLSDYNLIISNDAGLNSPTIVGAASLNSDIVTFTDINLSDGQYFTLGTARNNCGPGGITSALTVWLKANQGVKNGGNLATNGPIDEWENAIDNAGFTQLITGNQEPTKVQAGINFNPYISFDGINDDLILNNLDADEIFSDRDNTIFFSFNMATGGTGVVVGGWESNDPSGERLAYYEKNSSALRNDMIGGNNLIGTENIADRFVIATTLSDVSNRTLSINGNLDDQEAAASFASSGNTGDFALGSRPGASNYTTSQAGELIIFNDNLSPEDIRKVETYLAIKYGITLNNSAGGEAGDYRSAQNTLLWDASINASYHHDVAGIGRDDDACFVQKQSSSSDGDDILTIGLGLIASNNDSNVSSFADDGDYLIWGNDNGSIDRNAGGLEVSDVPGNVSERMTRIWKVEDTGNVGETEIQFDLAGTNFATGDASTYSLLVGNSATMADATVITGGTFTGDVLSFTGIDLSNGQFFTIGSNFETCGPGGVNTNISLWLRADKETFSDAGNTATTNLDKLQQWNDQSAPASNATEVDLGGAAVLPTYRTEEFNFNPVIRFFDPNSTNASFMRNGTNSVSQDFTLISVFKSGQSDGSSNDFVNSPALIGADVNGSNNDYGLGIENGRVFIKANTTTGTFDAETPDSYNDNFVHLATATRDESSGQVQIFIDSELADTGTGATGTLSAPTSFGIGNHNDPNINAQFSGDIAETLVYDRVLTETERARVDSYLAIKYGVTRVISGLSEAAEDYLAGDGGVIWDIDAQGITYHHDIFGIGRDDLSCFEQVKSKSENADALVTFDINGSFASDDSWLISGNDNADIEQVGNGERPASIKSRLNREWRVQETGTVGTIRLSYNLSTISGPSGIGTNNLNQTRLMVDDDGNFGNGGTTLLEPVAIDGSNDIVTFEVDFNTGEYYTLGSVERDALPITLLSFDAMAKPNNQVELTWTTADETNNSFFSIERSANGTEFTSIGRVSGAGNSNDILNYQYIDTYPLNGFNFYRLKQTDFSGEYSYSDIQAVDIKGVEQINFNIYPNPLKQGEDLNIGYSSNKNQKVEIGIYNTTGTAYLRKKVQLSEGQNLASIPTHLLQPGLHLVRIIDEEGRITVFKFIIEP